MDRRRQQNLLFLKPILHLPGLPAIEEEMTLPSIISHPLQFFISKPEGPRAPKYPSIATLSETW